MKNNVTIRVEKCSGKGSAYMALNHPSLDNSHILITGSSGTGKTVGSATCVNEYLKNGISVFAIDATDGLRLDTMPEFFYHENQKRINVISVYDEGLGMNLLERKKNICK